MCQAWYQPFFLPRNEREMKYALNTNITLTKRNLENPKKHTVSSRTENSYRPSQPHTFNFWLALKKNCVNFYFYINGQEEVFIGKSNYYL